MVLYLLVFRNPIFGCQKPNRRIAVEIEVSPVSIRCRIRPSPIHYFHVVIYDWMTTGLTMERCTVITPRSSPVPEESSRLPDVPCPATERRAIFCRGFSRARVVWWIYDVRRRDGTIYGLRLYSDVRKE